MLRKSSFKALQTIADDGWDETNVKPFSPSHSNKVTSPFRPVVQHIVRNNNEEGTTTAGEKDLSHLTLDIADDEEEAINFMSSQFILQNLRIANEGMFLDGTGTLAARSYISRSICLQISFMVWLALKTFSRAPIILIIGAGHNGKALIQYLIECGCANFIRIFARGDYTTNYWNSRNIRSSNSIAELLELNTADIVIMCSGMSSFSSICRLVGPYVSKATFFISSCFGLPRKRIVNTLKTPNVWRTFQESAEIMAESEGKSFTDVFSHSHDGLSMEEQAADLIVRRCPRVENMILMLENYYALRGLKHVAARKLAIIAMLGSGMSKTLPNFDDDLEEETKSFEPIETIEQHTTTTILEEDNDESLKGSLKGGESVRNEDNNPNPDRGSLSSWPRSPDVSALPSRSGSFNENVQILMDLEQKALTEKGVYGMTPGVVGGAIHALAAGMASTKSPAGISPSSAKGSVKGSVKGSAPSSPPTGISRKIPSVLANESGKPSRPSSSRSVTSVNSDVNSGSVAGDASVGSVGTAGTGRRSILEERKRKKKEDAEKEAKRKEEEDNKKGDRKTSFKPQRPKSAMEVETAVAILEDRVAVPFQRHFSRHIYVTDIPRVDHVHPNAGGIQSKRLTSSKLNDLMNELGVTDSKVLLGGLNLQELEDMDFGGSKTGSRGESRGGSAGMKGRGDTPEDLVMKRKVRLQQGPQVVVKGDHHPSTDDMLSHTGSALTGDDAYADDGEATDNFDDGNGPGGLSAYALRKRELEQIRLMTKLKVVEDLDSKPRPKDPLGIPMHPDEVILRLVEEDMILFDDEDRRRNKASRSHRDALEREDDDDDDEEEDENAGLTEAEITARAVKAARFDALMELLAELDEADNKAEFVEYDEAEEGAGSGVGTPSMDSLSKELLLETPNIRSTRKSQEGYSTRSANSAGKESRGSRDSVEGTGSVKD